MSVTITDWGRTLDGTPIQQAILDNGILKVYVITYAAAIRSVFVPDKNGNPVDIAIGYDCPTDYQLNGGCVGATVGRYANRIRGAQFVLNGETIHITPNEYPNSLHGGTDGFQYHVFSILSHDENGVTMTCRSKDGSDGFKGNVDLTVTYRLDGRRLVMEYSAVTDYPTVCNVTNHSYFNLNGFDSGTIEDHLLTLDSSRYLETDNQRVPNGTLAAVVRSPMDFRNEKPIGQDINADFLPLKIAGGYDHCFAVDGVGLRRAARLIGTKTGIAMDVLFTAPGLQFYTANNLRPKTPGKNGYRYPVRSAVCLEPQFYPNSPNQPSFPDTTLLPGQQWHATTIYEFDTVK